MKLASSKSREAGPTVANTKLLNSSFHQGQRFYVLLPMPLFWFSLGVGTSNMINACLKFPGDDPLPSDFLSPKPETSETSYPLLLLTRWWAVSHQVLILPAGIFGMEPSLCPVSVISTFTHSVIFPHLHCCSSLLTDHWPTLTPVNRCHEDFSRSEILCCSTTQYQSVVSSCKQNKILTL